MQKHSLRRQQMDNPKQPKNSGQKQYDRFMVNALNILHSEEVTDGIVKRVVVAEDKVDAIGNVALDIINRLEQSAGEKNFQINAGTIINGANSIIGEVIEIAEAAGMEPLNDEQKYQAFSWTISNYLNNAVESGKISKEDLVKLGQEMAQTKEGQAVAKQAIADEQAAGQPGILKGGA